MARLTIQRAAKRFGANHVIQPLSLDVADGEFLAVLGPSGCGKTTLLRLVAGFEALDEGRILIGGEVMSAPGRHVPPEDRRIGIVFQSYALWPHMTVAENVAYGLRVARVGASERRVRVDEALAIVGLENHGNRRPSSLSGGQRQRVALARCLVTRPSLILLDEPLANLDVHLRASLEDEFRTFHKHAGTTMLYITHDQAEAMALADRIAVLDRGRLMQVATPPVIYREPATEMVARFIGASRVFPAKLVSKSQAGRCVVDLLGVKIDARCDTNEARTGAVLLSLRPRDLQLGGAGPANVSCRVKSIVYRGGGYLVEAIADNAPDMIFMLDLEEPISISVGDEVHVAPLPQRAWVVPDGMQQGA